MTINTVTTGTGLGALGKEIFADAEFRAGMAQAAKGAAKALADAWSRHRGTEIVIVVIRDALNARR